MADALMPCPFCGNTKVSLVPYSQVHHDEDCECYNESHPDAWAVNCDASGTSGSHAPGCGAMSGVDITQAKAIKKWNTRGAPNG